QHTAGDLTVTPVATATVYPTGSTANPLTGTPTYTWFSYSATPTGQIQSQTVTWPVVTAAQHGPGGAGAPGSTSFHAPGHPVWHQDGDGFLTYLAYDLAKNAVVKVIEDVNTKLTTDFTGLPANWSTPAGGGLHLITTAEADNLGRATKVTDPKGNVSYAV